MKRLLTLAALLVCAALLVMAQDNTSSVTTVGVHGWDNAAWDRIRGSENTGLATTSPLTVVSDTQAQAFSHNPMWTNGGELHAVVAVSGSKRMYFESVAVTSSGATLLTIFAVNATPTACGTGSPGANLSLGGSGSTGLAFVCPGGFLGISLGAVLGQIRLVSGGTYSIDLTGVIAPAGSGRGVAIQASSGSGLTYSANFKWYEK